MMGSVMQQEPNGPKRRRSTRVQIANVPTNVGREDLERLVATFGTVQKCELVSRSSDPASTVLVTYDTPEQADQAVNQLNEYNYQGSVLKVEFAMENNGRIPNKAGGPRPPRRPNNGVNRNTGYPLRILVPTELVGAIIGRKGATIRSITAQTRARVDVHRSENAGLLEQVISVYGQPENCTNACKEILKIMETEFDSSGNGEVVLKMLADDRYCGRIIGKEGKIIKKIRDDTETRITVSKNYSFAYHWVQDVPAVYPDRVITIKGSIDGMASAEGAISNVLAECYEKEAELPMGHPSMMGGGPGSQSGMPLMSDGPYQMRYQYSNGQEPNYYPQQGMYADNSSAQPPVSQPLIDMCQIKVPNSAVGAIIGAGGANVKQIIRDSSAFVTIERKNNDDPNPAADRLVTVKGSQESQWRACYFIYEKLQQEGFSGNDEVRLCCIIYVPRPMAGKVIGKGGKNVRDIQRMTGAMVRIPEDQESQGDDVPVEIFGSFLAAQNGMSKVRALIMGPSQGPGQDPSYQPHQYTNQPPMPPRRRGPPRDQN